MKIAVLGGGLGGLAAAIATKARIPNAQVTIFEKNQTFGGKAQRHIATVRKAGEDLQFTFDTGPTLMTMKEVVEELFALASQPCPLIFEKLEPITRYFFEDIQVDSSHDIETFKHELSKLSSVDAANLGRFFKYTQRLFKLSNETFIKRPIFSLRMNLQVAKSIPFLWRLDPFRSVRQSIDSYFQDERVRNLFYRYTTYTGSDPYKAPATLNLIPYVEHILGSYYIKGGIYELVEALIRLARDLGVELRLNSEISQIISEAGKRGITQNAKIRGLMVNGAEERFDAVISNADVVHTYKLLDDKMHAKRVKLEPSCSGLVFLWGVRGKSNLAHHNILFSNNYPDEFKAIEERRVPLDPTIYIVASSKSDPHHAPSGYENWFILVNTYPVNGHYPQAHVDEIKRKIFNKLKTAKLDITAENIIYEHTISPEDILRNTNSNQGSIYGISSNSRYTAFMRQPNRERSYQGLYFAGGSAHPGGGMPMVIRSGLIAAEAVARDNTK